MAQDEFSQEVERLRASFDSYSRENRRVTRVSLAITLVILCIFAVFGTINVSRVRQELTREKLTASVQTQLIELQPKAVEELRALGDEIAPVYAAELQAQARQKSPEISRRLAQELDTLIEDVLRRTHVKLRGAEEVILERCTQTIMEAYPKISADREARQKVATRIHEITEGAVLRSLDEFSGLFAPDVKRFEETLLSFDLTDTHESKVDLQKRFLRLWLQLLDQEIMEL